MNRIEHKLKEQRLGNSVHVVPIAIGTGEVVNPCLRCRYGPQGRSVLLSNFVLNGQESASNPQLHIHAESCASL